MVALLIHGGLKKWVNGMKVIWKENRGKTGENSTSKEACLVISDRELFCSYLSRDTPPNRPVPRNKSSLVKMPLMAEVIICLF